MSKKRVVSLMLAFVMLLTMVPYTNVHADCAHPSSTGTLVHTKYEQIDGNDENHLQIDYYVMYCDYCDEVTNMSDERKSEKAHAFDSDNECQFCGYKISEESIGASCSVSYDGLNSSGNYTCFWISITPDISAYAADDIAEAYFYYCEVQSNGECYSVDKLAYVKEHWDEGYGYGCSQSFYSKAGTTYECHFEIQMNNGDIIKSNVVTYTSEVEVEQPSNVLTAPVLHETTATVKTNEWRRYSWNEVEGADFYQIVTILGVDGRTGETVNQFCGSYVNESPCNKDGLNVFYVPGIWYLDISACVGYKVGDYVFIESTSASSRITITVTEDEVNACDHNDYTYTDYYIDGSEPVYEDTGDGSTHLVRLKYNRVCDNCGEIIKEVLSDGTPEQHNLVDDACTLCTYVNLCDHDFVKKINEKGEYVEVLNSGTWVSVNEDTHKRVSLRYVEVCTKCGKERNGAVEPDILAQPEKHNYGDVRWNEYQKNDTKHWRTGKQYCRVCGETATVYSGEQPHTSETNCTTCGYSNKKEVYPNEEVFDGLREDYKDLEQALLESYYTDRLNADNEYDIISGIELKLIEVFGNGLADTVKDEVIAAIRDADKGLDGGREIVNEMVLTEINVIQGNATKITKDIGKLAGIVGELTPEKCDIIYAISQLSNSEYITLLDGGKKDWSENPKLRSLWLTYGLDLVEDKNLLDTYRIAAKSLDGYTIRFLKSMKNLGKFASNLETGKDFVNTLCEYTFIYVYQDEVNAKIDSWIEASDNEDFVAELESYKKMYAEESSVIVNSVLDSKLGKKMIDETTEIVEGILKEMVDKGVFGNAAKTTLNKLGASVFMKRLNAAENVLAVNDLIYQYGFGVNFKDVYSSTIELITVDRLYREAVESMQGFGVEYFDLGEYEQKLRLVADLAKLEYTYYIELAKSCGVLAHNDNTIVNEYSTFIDTIDEQLEDYFEVLYEEKNMDMVIR